MTAEACFLIRHVTDSAGPGGALPSWGSSHPPGAGSHLAPRDVSLWGPLSSSPGCPVKLHQTYASCDSASLPVLEGSEGGALTFSISRWRWRVALTFCLPPSLLASLVSSFLSSRPSFLSSLLTHAAHTGSLPAARQDCAGAHAMSPLFPSHPVPCAAQ